jgi:hypothetical protein
MVSYPWAVVRRLRIPETPGGSVVERSLETLAADRGITICFADLDGADGLWVPEERTILVNSRLSGRRADEVIEHELAHVAIEDGHAALDAGMHGRRVGRARWAAALTAAACLGLIAVLQLRFGVPPSSGGPTHDPQVVVAPNAPVDDQDGAEPSAPSGSGAPTGAPPVTERTAGEDRSRTVSPQPPGSQPPPAATASNPATPAPAPPPSTAQPPPPSSTPKQEPPPTTTSPPPASPTPTSTPGGGGSPSPTAPVLTAVLTSTP